MTPKLSIVVPVYNEANNIRGFLRAILENIKGTYELLLVYDLDDDDTIPVVESILKETPDLFPTLKLIKNEVCRGPSGALRTGFAHAIGNEVLVTMADLSDDLSQVQSMQRFLRSGYDIVAPSRYCKGGSQNLSGIRTLVPKLVGSLLYYLAGFPAKDATNSFRLYSKDLLDGLELVNSHSFGVTLEIIAKAHVKGARIREIPTHWNIRTAGESKFPFLASIFSYLPWFSLALTRNRLFRLPVKLDRQSADNIF